MRISPLAGFTVAVTADRRRDEQVELLSRLGARVICGPAVRTLPLAHGQELAAATRSVIARPPDVVVATTGVGMRGWIAASESLGLDAALLEALASAEILARGPKAAGAVTAAGLEVSWRAPTEQGVEVISYLRDRGVDGLKIAVQRDGDPVPVMADALAEAGAEVTDVPVYAWVLPTDTSPVERLVEALVDGGADAVTFTSSPAVRNLFELAGPSAGDLRVALADRAVACVGPVCARTAAEYGLTSLVGPRRPRLGAMVAALGDHMSRSRTRISIDGLEVTTQGALVATPAGQVILTSRERGVMARLVERPGRVVSKAELLEGFDGSSDTHAVEAAVSRLRRRLEPLGVAVRTVPRRGYRLAS